MRHLVAAVLAAMLAANAPAYAQPDTHGSHGSPSPADAGWTQGEVKKVEKDTGKVTIKHGPLTNLDMPAMTMVFRVKEPAMLEAVKAGDGIRFKADRVAGNYTVVELKVGE